MPSGLMSASAVPIWPIIHSRPTVGVAKRVRTMDGMPTMKVSVMPPTPAMSVIHDGRNDAPSTSRNSNHDPTVNRARPTPVHSRGIPTCTSIANAAIDTMIAASAHPLMGRAAKP